MKRHRFLFVCLLILGKDTAYRNLRNAIGRMDDVDSTWVPIEMNPRELIARIPPASMNHSLKFGLVARSRIRAIERSGKTFDAAFFNHLLPALFLKDFRRRVPSIDAMDVTPLGLLRDGQPYYARKRTAGGWLLHGLKRYMVHSVYRSAAYLLPQSNYTRRSLVHDYGMAEDIIRVLAPGVNLTRWHAPSNGSQKRRSRPFRFLFVGSDFLRKGGNVLLDIARRPEFQNCEFHFVTRSFQGDPSANVIVHPRITAGSDELMELYASADVFVLPTRSDFAPTNSICEAMAMGLPVVATGVGGLDEVVISGETGFVVGVGDENSLAEHLLKLRDNPGICSRLGRNARALAETRFNLVDNARAIVEYMKMAAERETPSGRDPRPPAPLEERAEADHAL